MATKKKSAKKKKPQKMDHKLVSAESHELKYLAKKSKKSIKKVKEAKKTAGRSRVAVEAILIPEKADTKKVFDPNKIKPLVNKSTGSTVARKQKNKQPCI